MLYQGFEIHRLTSIWLRPLEKIENMSSSDKVLLKPTGEKTNYSFQQMEDDGREGWKKQTQVWAKPFISTAPFSLPC